MSDKGLNQLKESEGKHSKTNTACALPRLMLMWQTLKKISPKSGISLPTAKKNHRGRIVSAPGELKKLLAKEYKDRLRISPRRPDLLYLDEAS